MSTIKNPHAEHQFAESLFLVQKLSLLSGIPIRSTLDNSTTVQYAGLIMQLTNKARSTVSMHLISNALIICKYDGL